MPKTVGIKLTDDRYRVYQQYAGSIKVATWIRRIVEQHISKEKENASRKTDENDI